MSETLRKFDHAVAISYAGEQRDYVERLVARLRVGIPGEKIFYDREQQAVVVTLDMDLKLAEVYGERSEVVVACLSREYADKKWTAHEGRAIRDLVVNHDGDRVVVLKFDQAVVRGLAGIGGRFDVQKFGVDEIVEIVRKRLELVRSDERKKRRDASPPPHDRPQNLPYESIGTLFKGRGEFLDELRQRLLREPGRATAIVARQAIHGSGGVGKTRLAVEYAWKHRADYGALLFVTARTPQDLRRSLADLCGPLVLNLPEQAVREEDAKVAAALRWLDQNPGWFLILDNVDDREAATAVEELLPRLGGGHVLVTSRYADWGAAVEPLELDVLARNAAAEFLLQRTEKHRRKTAQDRDDANEVARELGDLALALEQAGAFVWVKRCSLRDYLERWRSHDHKVRKWFDQRLMKYPRSVAVTWDTTFEQLSADASALLRVVAWLAPDPIPRFLFETDTARKWIPQIDDAIAELASFSLLRLVPGPPEACIVHRLVQEIVRERQTSSDDSLVATSLALVDAASSENPRDVRAWPRWEPLAPHLSMVAHFGDVAGVSDPTADLMRRLGVLFNAKACSRWPNL